MDKIEKMAKEYVYKKQRKQYSDVYEMFKSKNLIKSIDKHNKVNAVWDLSNIDHPSVSDDILLDNEYIKNIKFLITTNYRDLLWEKNKYGLKRETEKSKEFLCDKVVSDKINDVYEYRKKSLKKAYAFYERFCNKDLEGNEYKVFALYKEFSAQTLLLIKESKIFVQRSYDKICNDKRFINHIGENDFNIDKIISCLIEKIDSMYDIYVSKVKKVYDVSDFNADIVMKGKFEMD